MGGRVTGYRAGSKLLLPAILLFCVSILACNTDLRDQIELFVQVKNSGIVYVDGDTGNDDSPGTPELPKKTIQKAIDLAAGLLERGKVYIAEGIYILDETLEVREGISIYGGFVPYNWDRDIASNPTILQGSNIDTVIKPEAGVTAATVIDGFEIKVASETTAACIWCRNSSPTIRFNTLDAANGITSSIGIFNQFCSPVIVANTINAGEGSGMARGILNEGASPRIWSNVIYGTGDNSTYIGISCNADSDAVIQNNTIRCGLSAGDVGIYNSDSNCIIENNILFSASISCGIQEVSTTALPVRVNKNDFFTCSQVYKHSAGVCVDVGAMETYLDDNYVPYEGNRDDNPLFEGAMNWRLQDTSPVRDQGIALTAFFTIDRDGLPRTDPWSIGAYEKD